MSRQRKGAAIHGVVLLDKPAGLSSNRAMQQVRRLFNAAKAGHTGTLDPFATGMLPVCLGEACKTVSFLLDAGKRYRARTRFGIATSTADPEGEVIRTATVPQLGREQLLAALAQFTGEIQQVPPMYSALKQGGRPLYELARRGEVVERQPRKVHISRLELLDWDGEHLEFEVACSKGTYIRTLAEDLAATLGSCGHLVALRRLAVEPFPETGMVSPEQLQAAAEAGLLADLLLPADAGLPGWPVVELGPEAAAGFLRGMAAETGAVASRPVGELASGWVRVRDSQGHLLGLGELGPAGRLQPKRVFNT